MKRKHIIAIFIILIFFYLIFLLIPKKNTDLEENNDNINFTISINKIVNCDYKPKLYYKSKEYNIYTYCINEIFIDETKKLSNYIKEDNEIINKILDNMIIESIYHDGGTLEYKGFKNSEISSEVLTIIKCHNNNDIYIGSSDMTYKINFCIDNNKTFIKTYKILDIKEYEDNSYEITSNNYEITLEDFYGNIETVVVRSLFYSLEKEKTYEFEFIKNNNTLEDNIKSIFLNASIVEIRETNKTLENQVNESIN